MNTAGLNLLVPDKSDVERDAVAAAFAKCGGTVHRIGRFWDPPNFDRRTVRVYGPDSFCLVLQQKLGLVLHSPDDGLLCRVPPTFLNRSLSQHTLGEISRISFPSFIKPLVPKQFRGVVYDSAAELLSECQGLAPQTILLVSSVVSFSAEARTFVLDDRVLGAATYEGTPNAADALNFVARLAREMLLPRTVVVDVGFVDNFGWLVIEFNAAWELVLTVATRTKCYLLS